MQLNSRVLTSATGEVLWTGIGYLTGLYIPTALVGTITLTGLVDVSGAATNWVIPVGAVGTVCTAAKITFSNLTSTLSSGSDSGKAVATWERVN